MESLEHRRKLMTFALRLTEGTALAPDAYEQELLRQYLEGSLTIEQVVERLAVRDNARNL